MDLPAFDGKTAKLTLKNGEEMIGACVYQNREFCEAEFGIDDACMQVEECMVPEQQIKEVQLVFDGAVESMGDFFEIEEPLLAWLEENTGRNRETFAESIHACVREEADFPRWFVLHRKGKLLAAACVTQETGIPSLLPEPIHAGKKSDAAFLIGRIAAWLALAGKKELLCPEEMMHELKLLGWKEAETGILMRFIGQAEIEPMVLEEEYDGAEVLFRISADPLLLNPVDHASMVMREV